MPYTYGTGRWIGRASDAETWGRDAMAHAGADGYRDEETTGTRTPAPPLLRLYPYAEYMRPSTGPACYFADVVDGLREADAAEMADLRAELDAARAREQQLLTECAGYDIDDLLARAAKLREAAGNYMSQFGQALEAHGIPFTDAQDTADRELRAALAEGEPRG